MSKRNTLLGLMAVMLVGMTPVVADLMCYPPSTREPVVYNDVLQPHWYPHEWGSVANLYGSTTGMNGSYAIEVQYATNWGEFIIARSSANDGKWLWKMKDIRALTFRVKGIHNNCEKQIWVHLRDKNGQDHNPVPVTNYMVSPESVNTQQCWQDADVSVGIYDPDKWYTVVIPISAFVEGMFIDPDTLVIKDVMFEGGHLGEAGMTELPTVYLDDIWWVEGLEFPLAGYEADTAAITALFDHTMTNGVLGADGTVTAYTGEVGDGDVSSSDSTCITGDDTPYNDIISNYVSAGECHENTTVRLTYLSYDGHPSYDYAWPGILGTPIYAPADGEVVLSDCTSHPGVVDWDDVAENGSECLGRGTGYGKLIIDHTGPYMTSINHVAYVRPGLDVGTRVAAGELVAYVGNTHTDAYGTPTLIAPHLHIGFLLDEGDAMYIPHRGKRMGTYVDPYGWIDETHTDPHRVKAVSVPLWK